MIIKLSRSSILIVTVSVFLIIAMLVIAKVQGHISDKLLERQFHEQGVALTNALSRVVSEKSNITLGMSLMDAVKEKTIDAVDNEIRDLIKSTLVLKLKIYSNQGFIQYSTNRNDVVYANDDDEWIKKSINTKVLDVVKTGKGKSSYSYRTQFDSGDGIFFNRYILSTYVPAKVSGEVLGVVEIYYDVTNVVNDANENRKTLNIFLFVVCVVLLVMIGWLILRNERIIQHKDKARNRYLLMLRRKRKDLIRKTREITSIKERTEKIAEDRSQFMSRMSHELRTPMNAVIGLSDLMMRTNLTDRQKGYVNAIQSSGNMLLDITDEILTIGRLNNGYLEIRSKKFKLLDVIENVIEIMGNRACKKSLELICVYTPEIENYIIGDPVRLRQVLLNLVGNAIKYTASGFVKVSVRKIKGDSKTVHYHFSVSDTGVGIDEENRKKIFLQYCHLENRTVSDVRSTGLGLAISKRLVEVMNGAIGVRSVVNEGSTFWFKLPFQPDDEILAEVDDNKVISKQQRILAVVNDMEAGNCLVDTFGQWGVGCDVTLDTDEALRLIDASYVDIEPYTTIFIDSRIGGQCGIVLAKSIREQYSSNNTKIVFLVPITETLQKGVVSKIYNTTCINKPILPSGLKMLLGVESGVAEASEYNIIRTPENTDNFIPSGNHKQVKILVVEDNPVNRELMLEMLSELNVFAEAVADGHGVFERIMEEHFDLVLLDCRLPDMEGYEIIAKIRQLKIEGKQPIIVVTSSDITIHTMQLCYESGVDDFLHKPIKINQLSKTIFSWVPAYNKLEKSNKMNETSIVVNLFSAPILDKSVISEIRKRETNNPDFFKKLINLFVDDCFERVDDIKSQLEKGNYPAIEKIAHSIKSGCLHIGAKRMAKYCEVLSNMARNQSYPETRRALQHFIEEFDRVILEADRELNPEMDPEPETV